jgi:hypothetical protein
MNKNLLPFAVLLPVLSVFPAWPHGGEKHEGKGKGAQVVVPEEARKKALEMIGTAYKKDVRPIFKVSCFNCHSGSTRYPWYHKIPGIRGMIDGDIEEARMHLDLSKGFPFEGHGSPEEDLKAIRKVVEKGSMPPWNYRLMHWGSGLSKDERKTVKDWIDRSLKELESSGEKQGGVK